MSAYQRKWKGNRRVAAKAASAALVAPLLSMGGGAAGASDAPAGSTPQQSEPVAAATLDSEDAVVVDVVTGEPLSSGEELQTYERIADEWTPFAGDDEPVPPLSVGTLGGPADGTSGGPGPTFSSILYVRGGSLIPPSDGRTIYWDALGPGYEVLDSSESSRSATTTTSMYLIRRSSSAAAGIASTVASW